MVETWPASGQHSVRAHLPNRRRIAVIPGFGTTVRWHDRESKSFFCPACGNEREYQHREARNWLKIIVPIIPRDVVDSVYECQGCHRQYDEHVITSPPTSDLSTRLQRATRAAAVLAMLDGDPYHEPSRTKAVNVVRGAGLRHYTETDLDADLRSMDVSNLDVEAQQLTIDLDITGREHLLLDVGHVAIASGGMSHTNRVMLDRLGRSLELSPGSVHRLMTQLDQEAAAIAAFAPAPPRNQAE